MYLIKRNEYKRYVPYTSMITVHASVHAHLQMEKLTVTLPLDPCCLTTGIFTVVESSFPGLKSSATSTSLIDGGNRNTPKGSSLGMTRSVTLVSVPAISPLAPLGPPSEM